MAERDVATSLARRPGSGVPRIVGRALRNLGRFSGRDTRPQFWWYVLVNYAFNTIMSFLIPRVVLGGLIDSSFRNRGLVVVIFGPVLGVVLLAATVVRRLHDTDRAGWWAWLPVVPAVITYLWVLEVIPVGTLLIFPVFMLANVASWIALVVLLAKPGTDGPNRFGPDPGPSVSRSASVD